MCAEDRMVCVLLCIQCQGITWDGGGQVGAGGHPYLARGGVGGAHTRLAQRRISQPRCWGFQVSSALS